MKRKHTLIEDSDDDTDVNNDNNVAEHPENLVSKKQRKKRSKRRWTMIFISLCVPLAAVIYQYSETVMQQADKYTGEKCSSSYWLPKNLTLLKSLLDENVFGQHIATKLILSGLSRRWETNYDYQKPLVMSFHGWTGSGKNYVAKFIADSLFRKGLKSKHVHTFVSTVHFYDERNVFEYKRQLHSWILGNVTSCPETLFIFDEVDKMPMGILDSLKPFMDYHASFKGADMSKAVFILLSNTGGRQITKTTYDFWQGGRLRDSLQYTDLENLISDGAFNENGGLKHSTIIDKSLIDVYVPFLPLESGHVKQCIQKELRLRGYIPDNVDQVLKQLTFWPPDTKVFATAGCKRVAQKVDEFLYEQDL
jgi:hypothetical protein